MMLFLEHDLSKCSIHAARATRHELVDMSQPKSKYVRNRTYEPKDLTMTTSFGNELWKALAKKTRKEVV
jgi:hypothetical protein